MDGSCSERKKKLGLETLWNLQDRPHLCDDYYERTEVDLSWPIFLFKWIPYMLSDSKVRFASVPHLCLILH